MSVTASEMKNLAKELRPVMKRTIKIGKRIYEMDPGLGDYWLDNDAVDLQNSAEELYRKVLQITDRLSRIEGTS